MRYLWTILAVLGLAAPLFAAEAVEFRPLRARVTFWHSLREDRRPSSEAVVKVIPAEGTHQSAEGARERALEAAQLRLTHYLRELKPDSRWSPSRAYVARLVRSRGNPEWQMVDPPVGKACTVRLDVVVTQSDYEDLLKQLRFEEARERQWGLTKGVLIALAVLATVAGYFRLEDATKGYYTGWLRLGGIIALLAAAAGILLLP